MVVNPVTLLCVYLVLLHCGDCHLLLRSVDILSIVIYQRPFETGHVVFLFAAAVMIYLTLLFITTIFLSWMTVFINCSTILLFTVPFS